MSDQSEPAGQPEPEKEIKTEIYSGLLDRIQNEPHSDEVWKRAVELARDEEISGAGKESYYTKIPLDDLIATGEKLRTAKSRDGQYNILAQKCPTGEYWYDIILGHVNDKAFAPVATCLAHLAESRPDKKIKAGLDVGSGLGNTLRAMAPHFEKVTGVEKLSSLTELVKKDSSIPKNAEVVCADATRLPFDGETFDVVSSNGLTHYLKKSEMKKYVREIGRILKDGGAYFEALTIKNPDSQLPVTEMEYLTSAKALLVCLIDNIVSKVDDNDASWSFSEMVAEFGENRLYPSKPYNSGKDAGIVVISFAKDKKRHEHQ
jgi:ubiquinone/menaquinone biosynthesis C-methylase UbiE